MCVCVYDTVYLIFPLFSDSAGWVSVSVSGR